MFLLGHILKGYHRLDARQSVRFGGINMGDAGVGVGAAFDTAVYRARQVEVGGILGRAGHLFNAIYADWAAANNGVSLFMI